MTNVYIISAPSGAGKTSLVKGVCDLLPFVRPSISFTTRKIRESEIDGQDYFFVNEDIFHQKIKNNDFLEYQDVYGNMYGTTLESVSSITDSGVDVILEIDYKGMLAVKKVLPLAKSIYIIPPSIEELKQRLVNRAEDELEVINKRMNSSMREMYYAKFADYVLVNDDFDHALNMLKGIIVFNRIIDNDLSSWAKKLINLDNCIV
tara:strand:- start:1035 stop:1649 length:615 start_codon:yes stop_codon:yes gene_type:complete